MKKLPIAICVGFLVAVSLVCTLGETRESLSNGIIRLHVRANSNSSEDQQLKIKVHDRILNEAELMKDKGMSISEAETSLKDSLDKIEALSRDEILKNGFDYPVKVSLGKSRFPTKAYGDMTLPAGAYTALTVEIGSGEGDNWWCVMFPPLCFADETYQGTDPVSSKMLIESLGEETYSMVTEDKVQIKFKLYELIQKFL